MSQYSDYKIDSYVVKYVTRYPMIVLKGTAFFGANHSSHYFAELTFYPNDVALPEDILDRINRVDFIRLYFRISDFSNIIDILRNESPLRFIYTGAGGALHNNSGIYSDLEPIGPNDENPVYEFYPLPRTPV